MGGRQAREGKHGGSEMRRRGVSPTERNVARIYTAILMLFSCLAMFVTLAKSYPVGMIMVYTAAGGRIAASVWGASNRPSFQEAR